MKDNITHKDLEPLAEFINQMYGEEPIELVRYIDYAIYLLHYVQSSVICKKDRRKVCFILHEISEILEEAIRKH